ncbi:MAG: S41 family peptidase [Lachnospiraceae bacterium]
MEQPEFEESVTQDKKIDTGIDTQIDTQIDTKHKNTANYWRGLITGLAIALILICGTYVVSHWVSHGVVSSTNTIGTQGSRNQSIVNRMTMQKLKVLQETIKEYYVEEVDAKTLEEGAYAGIIKALGDPYSAYYTAKEWEDIKNQSKGVYFGIGATVGKDMEMNMVRILQVTPGSPAEESGMRADDYIYKVGDTYAKGMELEDVIALIKGPADTKVSVTVLRKKEPEPIVFEITRREIENITVHHETYKKGISYIQITEFDDVTLDQFTEALAMEKETGMKGLILDLRNNLGGNLNTVTEIARKILPEGIIVYTEDKYGKRVEYTCDGKNELKIPLVVLVNENSASASEILAGAIKDHDKGTLLGTTTYGKGVVQRFINLSDGTVVKLTVSRYFTPNGNNIHKIGIQPNEELELDAERYLKNGYDNQLERAKKIIEEQLS